MSKKDYFFQMPGFLARVDSDLLNWNAKAVYSYIYQFTFKIKDGKGFCKKSAEAIGKELGMSAKQVRKARTELKDFGMVHSNGGITVKALIENNAQMEELLASKLPQMGKVKEGKKLSQTGKKNKNAEISNLSKMGKEKVYQTGHHNRIGIDGLINNTTNQTKRNNNNNNTITISKVHIGTEEPITTEEKINKVSNTIHNYLLTDDMESNEIDLLNEEVLSSDESTNELQEAENEVTLDDSTSFSQSPLERAIAALDKIKDWGDFKQKHASFLDKVKSNGLTNDVALVYQKAFMTLLPKKLPDNPKFRDNEDVYVQSWERQFKNNMDKPSSSKQTILPISENELISWVKEGLSKGLDSFGIQKAVHAIMVQRCEERGIEYSSQMQGSIQKNVNAFYYNSDELYNDRYADIDVELDNTKTMSAGSQS